MVRLTADGNPLGGLPFYVNPKSKAKMAADGLDPRSPELDSIANTPTAYWMDNLSTPSVDAKYIADAQAAGTMPILALYGIPHRDCGSYAAGGFGSGDAYRGWIDGVAAAIGGGPAAVILERWRSLKMLGTDTQALRQRVLELLQADRAEEALEVCERERGPVSAVLSAGLKHMTPASKPEKAARQPRGKPAGTRP